MSFEQVTAPDGSPRKTSRWKRRNWFASLVASTVWIRIGDLAGCHQVFAAGSGRGAESLPTFRIRSVLELKGEVRLKNQGAVPERRNGKQLVARTAPVQSTTTLDYDEQYQREHGLDDRCLQYFHEAKTDIQVDSHVTKTELRETCREIVKQASPAGIISASPAQPLFAAERDLVEGSLTTMYLDELLTDEQVTIGDKWNVDPSVVAKLLNLDGVHDGKLTVCLIESDKEQAQLAIEGRLNGSVRQVATELVIEGKAILDRRAGFISWLAIQTKETREIGEAEPGFQVTASLRVLRAPAESMTHGRTLQEALEDIPNWETAGVLQFQSDRGFYRFLGDRRWMTYRDNGEEATLRFIVGNRRVAQCTVNNLIDFEPGRQLSLEGFQTDVRQMIRKDGHTILEASERLSNTDHRLLRVVVGGNTEGVPIRWVYYHVSNDTGRRLTLTFTLDEASLETFDGQDQQIASSLELLAWPTKLNPDELRKEQSVETTESAQSTSGTTTR